MLASMKKFLFASLLCCSAAAIAAPANKPEEVKAIAQVAEDFQAALKTKNHKQLAALMLNPNILFTSPATDEYVRKAREESDPNTDGVRAGGFHDFAGFLKREKRPVEERFTNVKITQDRDVAWMLFDYEFVLDGKVQNDGVEAWQLVKRDGKWKIYSVTWSVNPRN
jgi:hypothetical protein